MFLCAGNSFRLFHLLVCSRVELLSSFSHLFSRAVLVQFALTQLNLSHKMGSTTIRSHAVLNVWSNYLNPFYKNYHLFHSSVPLFTIFSLPGRPSTVFLLLEITNYLWRHRWTVPSCMKSPQPLLRTFSSGSNSFHESHYHPKACTTLQCNYFSACLSPWSDGETVSHSAWYI